MDYVIGIGRIENMVSWRKTSEFDEQEDFVLEEICGFFCELITDDSP